MSLHPTEDPKNSSQLNCSVENQEVGEVGEIKDDFKSLIWWPEGAGKFVRNMLTLWWGIAKKKYLADICKSAPPAQKGNEEKDGIWEVTEATYMESLMSCGLHPNDLRNTPPDAPVSS